MCVCVWVCVCVHACVCTGVRKRMCVCVRTYTVIVKYFGFCILVCFLAPCSTELLDVLL